MDAHLLPKDEDKIWKAYHSRDDLYRQFFLNGFNQVNKAIGEEWFQEEDWEFMAQLEEQPTTRHRFFFRAKKDVTIHKLNRTLKAGEELDWFDSHKYGEESVRLMCHKAGLSVIDVMQAPGSEFSKYPPQSLSASEHRQTVKILFTNPIFLQGNIYSRPKTSKIKERMEIVPYPGWYNRMIACCLIPLLRLLGGRWKSNGYLG